MSTHYSKFALNTYAMTPYFQSQLPDGYPINLVLQKSRAFRRLPPNLRKLAALAKKWAIRTYPDTPMGMIDIKGWYDEEGYELNPATGKRMTDTR